MVKAYINYPNSRISLHRELGCREIGKQHKKGQRRLRIDNESLSMELTRFKSRHYRFASKPMYNDMWLDVDLNDPIFERTVVEDILKILAEYYSPIRWC